MLVSLLLVFLCQGQSNSANFGKQSKVKLEEEFSVNFKERLFLCWDGATLFGWCNLKNSIKKFDFQKRVFYDECQSEIKNFDKYEAIVSVGSDSLFCFAWQDNWNANLINGRGKILRQYNLKPSKYSNFLECDKNRTSYCYLKKTISPTCYKGKLYYATQSMGEDKVKGKLFSSARLDLKNGGTEFVTEFPSIYHQYNWGAISHYFPAVTMNDKEQLVISYPACHKLYVYDLNTNTQKVVNGGSSLFEKVKPFSKEKKYREELRDEYAKYYQTNYVYGDIAYDKKRKVYYRMVWHPKKDYGKQAFSARDNSILVLDEQFNFLGEVVLPSEKHYYRLMFTARGLIIAYVDFKLGKGGFSLFKLKDML